MGFKETGDKELSPLGDNLTPEIDKSVEQSRNALDVAECAYERARKVRKESHTRLIEALRGKELAAIAALDYEGAATTVARRVELETLGDE